ncbi:MAG: hypothetical protein HY044_04435 [Candidatus Woesebacteria bacterium]|nr:MAG: hypothetical protein HY044_04435 [Candidatus Woesebacteria bacterium]
MKEILDAPLVSAFAQGNERVATHLVFAALDSLNGPYERLLFWKSVFALTKEENIVEGFFLSDMEIPGGLSVYEMPVLSEDGRSVCLGKGPKVLCRKVVPSKHAKEGSYIRIGSEKVIRIFFPYEGDEKYPKGFYFRVYIRMEDGESLSFLVDPDGNYLPPYLVPVSKGLDANSTRMHKGLTSNFDVMLLQERLSDKYWKD